MISGYTRKPTEFDWCGTKVWLLKLTQADHEAAFPKDGAGNGWCLDVIARSFADKDGNLLLTDRAAAEKYFRDDVALDDFAALGKLVMKHSGYDMDKVDVQKKS